MAKIEPFVPKTEEVEYLAKNHLRKVELPNGALILAGTREVDDAANADIEIEFPVGSVYDPLNKRGFVHIFEHFIATAASGVAQDSSAKFNASTSFTELGIQLQGIANPNFQDYGIWPVLPVIFHELKTFKEVTPQGLEHEQNIIKEEVAGRVNESSFIAHNHMLESIYGPNNPMRYIRSGDQTDQVTNVTMEDIQTYADRLLHPRGSISRLFVEGPSRITDNLIDIFAEQLSTLPSDGKPLPTFDQSRFNQVSDEVQPGKIYTFNTGTQTKTAIAHFAWLSEVVPYSTQTFAQSSFFSEFGNRAFRHLRKEGLAYYFSNDSIRPNGRGQYQVQFIRLELINSTDIKDKVVMIAKQLQDQVLPGFTKEDLLRIIARDRTRALAIPNSVGGRLRSAVYGMQRFGQIIDPDKVDQLWDILDLKDMKQAQESVAGTKSMIFLSGGFD